MNRMPRSTLRLALLSFVCTTACATSSQPPTMVVAPTVPSPGAPGATPVAAGASPSDPPSPPADASAATNGDDAGAPARFRACTADSDCVAVPRVGCCRNGWKEAVAASQKDAYGTSFVCPDPHPICAMYLIHDTREPQCDRTTRLCTMIAK